MGAPAPVQQYDKLKFECRSNESGGPNGAMTTAGQTGPNWLSAHADKLKFEGVA